LFSQVSYANIMVCMLKNTTSGTVQTDKFYSYQKHGYDHYCMWWYKLLFQTLNYGYRVPISYCF